MDAQGIVPTRRSYGNARLVSGLQRARLLSATFALVGERGYGGVTARGVSERAGVSNRTFYQAFSDREECFLAAFDHAIDGLQVEVRRAWEAEGEWTARVRGALGVLLVTLDREPAVRRLLFVEALVAGPRVLTRRAEVLNRLAGVVDGGRAGGKAPSGLPRLTAAAVVGGGVGVIHARLLEANPSPLVELFGELMATIVLPYRGSRAAARELEQRGTRTFSSGREDPAGLKSPARLTEGQTAQSIAALGPLGSASPVDYRLTVRAQMALDAVAERPGLNNRQVSEVIGLSDQGQISRMMRRLQEHGLVENMQPDSKRLARAWRITAQGEAVVAAGRGEGLVQARRSTPKGVEPKSLRAQRGFRLTALTHEVLSVVMSLSEHGTPPTGREIAGLAGGKDRGQISKLLTRLEGHGLLRNTGGQTQDAADTWTLTARGEELLNASRSSVSKAAR